MKLRNICFIAVFVLLVANNATAQFGTPYAIKNFEKLSGLKIKPRNNFIICLGTTLKPLECEPTSGNWVKVQNVPFITLNNLTNDTSEVDGMARDQIINKYLGAAYYLGQNYRSGFLDSSCMSSDSPTSVGLKPILYDGPVRSTGLAQLVEEEIVKEAKISFRGLIDANKLGNKGKLEAAFEAELRNAIKGESRIKTDIKWVVVQLQADLNRLKSFPSTKACVDFARERKGSLVSGIAGFIIMSSAGSSSYVSTNSFKQAASAAFSATAIQPTPGVDSAVVTAAASWSSSTNRKITTTIETNSPQPTFYPLWVSFTEVN